MEPMKGSEQPVQRKKITVEFRGFSSPELVPPRQQSTPITPPVKRKKVNRAKSQFKLKPGKETYKETFHPINDREALTSSGEKTLTDKIDNLALKKLVEDLWRDEKKEHRERFLALRKCGKETDHLLKQLNGQLGRHWQRPLVHRDKEHKSNLSHVHALFIKNGHKDEEKKIKTLLNAAGDCWRTSDKIRILVEGEEGQFNVTQHLHELAYAGVEVAVPPTDMNERFLKVIACFNEHRKSRIEMPSPDTVEWSMDDHVKGWLVTQMEAIKTDKVFSRFMRTMCQIRYSGLAGGLFLKDHGDQNGVNIRAHVNTREASFTRIFYRDGHHEETIRMPIEVIKRDDQSNLCIIFWELHFKYSEHCNSKSIHSSARIINRDQLLELL